MEPSSYVEIKPIRKSIFFLIWKLFLLILSLDLVYTVLLLISLDQTVDFTWHHHITLGLLYLEVIKSVVQIFGVVSLIFSWVQDVYYIYPHEKKLIIERGILKIRRNTYDLQNIREIIVKQNFIGRLFRFGNVIINTSASGGYNYTITMEKIQNPYKTEDLLKTQFHSLMPTYATS